MALVKVNDLLRDATEHHYGVPAVNRGCAPEPGEIVL